jgi:hypothetical protein
MSNYIVTLRTRSGTIFMRQVKATGGLAGLMAVMALAHEENAEVVSVVLEGASA